MKNIANAPEQLAAEKITDEKITDENITAENISDEDLAQVVGGAEYLAPGVYVEEVSFRTGRSSAEDKTVAARYAARNRD